MKRWFNWPVLLLASCLTVAAQEALPDYFPVDPLRLIRELLGPDSAFTARAQISGDSTNADDDFILDLHYAMRGDEVRTEVDLSQIRGLHACEITQGRLHDVGMDEAIVILLPELRRSYTIYPRARAYAETPLTWHEDLKEIAEVTKTALGEEIVAGHPCRKYRVHVLNEMGDENDVLVWEARDLGNFPLQLRFEMPAATFSIRFYEVNRDPPALDLFQPPGDYDRYDSIPELSHALGLQ